MAATLEASGNYRAVRRLVAPDPLPSPPPGVRLGLVVDVETTGADLRGGEAIELAMVRFAYTPEGEVLASSTPLKRARRPSFRLWAKGAPFEQKTRSRAATTAGAGARTTGRGPGGSI